MSISLHIERLVFDGLDVNRTEAQRLQMALQAELAARLAAPGTLQKLRRRSTRGAKDSRQAALAPVAGQAPLAVQIAERVVGSLAHGRGAAPRRAGTRR